MLKSSNLNSLFYLNVGDWFQVVSFSGAYYYYYLNEDTFLILCLTSFTHHSFHKGMVQTSESPFWRYLYLEILSSIIQVLHLNSLPQQRLLPSLEELYQ